MHGYQITKELKKRQVADWAGISRPQVYYTLKKLEASGLIRGKDSGNSSQGPERRVFTVTEKAISLFANALESQNWATSRPAPLFSTWAMLSVHAPRSTVKGVIDQRRTFLQEEIAKEYDTLDTMDDEKRESTQVARMLISLTIEKFKLELTWLDEFEKTAGV